MKKIAILLSGRGSNFEALADAVAAERVAGRIVVVHSNNPQAAGLEAARRRGLAVSGFAPQAGESRESYDRRTAEVLSRADVEIICLAGYMRLLSPWLVRRFPMRILNIHPSLLPAFPGLHAQRQALQWGVKVSGCTVHFVDEKLDHGPVILQQAVEVHADDSEESLSARILSEEHRLYPRALDIVCRGDFRLKGRVIEEKSAPQPAARDD